MKLNETQLSLNSSPLLTGTTSELLERSVRNSFDCFKTLLCIPGAKLENGIRGLEGVVTKRPSALFNFFIATSEIASLDKDGVRSLVADFRSQSLPLCIELQQNTPQDIFDFVMSLNPAASDPSTQVIYEAQSIVPVQAPRGCSLRLMEDESDVRAFLQVMQAVWPNYGQLVDCFGEWIQHYGYGPSKSFQTAVLRHGGQVAGIGSLFFGNGIVSPFNIAVLPSLQKLGHGQTIIKSLVNLGFRHGFKYFAATGSTAGMHLYRKGAIQELGTSRRFIF